MFSIRFLRGAPPRSKRARRQGAGRDTAAERGSSTRCSVPGCRGLNGLTGAVVLDHQGTRAGFTACASGELRAMITHDDAAGGEGARKLLSIHMPPTCDAVNMLMLVAMLVSRLGPCEGFTLAFGELFCTFCHWTAKHGSKRRQLPRAFINRCSGELAL